MIGVELRKLAAAAADLGDVVLTLRAAGPRRGVPGRHPPGPAARPGSRVPVRRAAGGSLYPAAALALVLPVFLPVAVAVVAGDAIAGEAASGTLRYLLARPVGRTRLLGAKLVVGHRVRRCPWSWR